MSYHIGKCFHFEAAHHLTQVPDGHKCRRPHGHSYTVEFELANEQLDLRSMVRDYSDLGGAKALVATLDHQDLNSVLPFETTAENLARYLYEYLQLVYPELIAVRVSETADTWAEYRR